MLTHWNHINQLLNDFTEVANNTHGPSTPARRYARQQTGWTPADIRETDEALSFTMDVPGLTSGDVEVLVEDRVLKISGARPRPEGEGVTVHRSERRFGSFSRSFRLGPTLDPSGTTAEVTDGVLNVTVPKSLESKALRVEVL